MKKFILFFTLLAILPITALSQPILTHHFDICGTVESAPNSTGYIFQTELGYRFSFMQEIGFIPGTRVHVVGTLVDSCDIHEGVSQCLYFDDISECDCPLLINTCCVGYMGDINGDGGELLDISDLLFLIDYMFLINSPQLPCEDEVDFNGDGQIDISDLLEIVDWIFTPPPDIFPPPTPPLCPVDTVFYKLASDTGIVPAVYKFYYMPEGQLLVKDPYGFEYDGIYSGSSMIFYNWELIDAQSITSCTDCGDSMSCYDEVYTIAGPVYKKLYFIKIE